MDLLCQCLGKNTITHLPRDQLTFYSENRRVLPFPDLGMLYLGLCKVPLSGILLIILLIIILLLLAP